MPVHQRHWSQRKPYAYWGDAGGIWKHHIILCTRIRTCWWKHYLALTFGLLFTAPHTFSSLFFFTWTITVHRGSAGTVSFGCRATCFCSAVTRAYNLPSVGLSLHNTHLFILQYSSIHSALFSLQIVDSHPPCGWFCQRFHPETNPSLFPHTYCCFLNPLRSQLSPWWHQP